MADKGQTAALEGAAIAAVKAGDANAFGRLVEMHQHRLFSFCLMLMRRSADAEDVAQDAFVRAYMNLHRFEDGRPFYPWLATIALRLAQSKLRRPVHEISHEEPETAGVPEPEDGETALDSLIDAERGRQLWRAVEGLPTAQRTAVFLVYRQDMTVADAAHVLGVTAGTVKTLLFRARQRLRPRLQQQDIHFERTKET